MPANENIFFELESKVIKRFIIKEKQERYLTFIKTYRNRDKFLDKLPHFADFKDELFTFLPDVNTGKLVMQETALFSSCYIISENEDLDQKQLNAAAALNDVLDCGMGTILVFGDAEMLYFEGEGPSDHRITKKWRP